MMRESTKKAVWVGFLAVFGGCQPAPADDAGETETGESEEASTAGTGTDGGGTGTTQADDSTGDDSDTTGDGQTDTDAGDDTGSTSDGETTGPPAAPVPKDDVRMTLQDTAYSESEPGLLANDHRGIGAPPNGPERLGIVDFDAASVQGGTVTVTFDGAFDYDPPAGYWGWDSFGYTVDDTFQTVNAEAWIWVTPPALELPSVAAASVETGFTLSEAAPLANFGRALHAAGDVDGDGLDDLIIGARGADPNGNFSGAAYVLFSSAGTDVELSDIEDGTSGFVIRGAAEGNAAGTSVGGAGDINGDGLADLIVGSLSSTSSTAYVVFGKSDGTAIELSDVEAGTGGFAIHGTGIDGTGAAVSVAGDVNADGLSDVVVGAPSRDHGAGLEGSAYVVFGKADGTAVELSDVEAGTGGFAVNGFGEGDRVGSSVADAGDVDGDGFDDIIVGAPQLTAGGTGVAYVVFGKSDGTPVDLAAVDGGVGGFALRGEFAGDEAGQAVAGLGDINGDEFADVAVGAPQAGTFEGASYVVYGSDTPASLDLSDLTSETGFVLRGGIGANVGRSVSRAGDLDGDGLDDILVSGDKTGEDVAAAWVVFGPPDGPAMPDVIDLSGPLAPDHVIALRGEDTGVFGEHFVTGAGDVDGDGVPDFAVSDPNGNLSNGQPATTYVVYGGNWRGSLDCYGREDDDVLEATDQPNSIVAGLGDDVVYHGGEEDVISTGAGDDEIVVIDGPFPRVDGGTGTDTLRLIGNRTSLVWSALPGGELVDVEIVHLDDPTDQFLTVDRFDLAHASATSNLLTVLGGPEDTVNANLAGGGFSQASVVAGFVDYTNGVLTLRIDENLTINVTL